VPDLLEVTDLRAGYGQAMVLHGVSLSVKHGDIDVVLGRNGVGKTTLIRALMGLNPARGGCIRLAGRDITREPPEVIARLAVGLVPQGRRLFPSLTVREHLVVAARPPQSGLPAWTVDRVLRLFPRLGQRLDHRGGMLSGGEQTMVSIARALVGNPRLLLLDEPTEGLSPGVVDDVVDVLHVLRGEGVAILLVEQNLGMAMKLATRVHVLAKGCIAFAGSEAELRASPGLMHRLLGV
jgi:branched-chain amino acid transport system ATP-binding protein